jgi:uncharacterized protein
MVSIEPSDLLKSVEVLRGFGARRVWLFGSALDTPHAVNDLDLAVEGLPPQVFYRAVGRLLDAIGKPVDLVDLSKDSRLSRHIRSKGRLLYDG